MRQRLHHPAGASKQVIVAVARGHQLDADRQTVWPGVSRQGHRGAIQHGPELLEGGLAGEVQAQGRFAVDAGGDDGVDTLVRSADVLAAALGELQRGDVVLVLHREALLNAIAQHLADLVGMVLPVRRQALGALVIVDGLARGVIELGEFLGQHDLLHRCTDRGEPLRSALMI